MPMKRSSLLTCACLGLALAACSGPEAPRPAEYIEAPPAQQDFGNLRVHFNVLPTLALGEAVARQYGVARRADTALVVVAVRKLDAGQETATTADVSAVATDLSGHRQSIGFAPARTGDYVDQIGTFRYVERDRYRFEVNVTQEGRTQVLEFQRGF